MVVLELYFKQLELTEKLLPNVILPLHQRLQAAAHQAGFRVATRPLPPGVTISGSPDGTRSQAQ